MLRLRRIVASGHASPRCGINDQSTTSSGVGRVGAPTDGEKSDVRKGGMRRWTLLITAAAVVVCLGGKVWAVPNNPGGSIGGNPVYARIAKLVASMGVLASIGKHRESIKQRAARATRRALDKVMSKKVEAILIPFVAAFVGWFTNWLAVQMIFYPVEYLGLNLKRWVLGSVYGCDVLQPLGILGWQGIVPAKAAKMAHAMVNMVTTKLIHVPTVFARLDPWHVATLLQPEIPELARNIGLSLFPSWIVDVGEHTFIPKLTADVRDLLLQFQHQYLAGFVRCLQANITKVLDVDEFVVNHFVENKPQLNAMFKTCGQAELDFLVNSGVWFGFLLGLPQVVVWAFVDNIWTLVIGGSLVGYATNWLALKLIFEPVYPTKFGPFTVQGIFLSRQQEVSTAFAEFYTRVVLKSKLMWDYLFNGSKRESFKELLAAYNVEVVDGLKQTFSVAQGGIDGQIIDQVTRISAEEVCRELPKHVHVLHEYIDRRLGLQPLLESSLKRLTPHEFERVLHPVFEEEEFILIMAGAFLGAAAGALQHVVSEAVRKGEPIKGADKLKGAT